MTAIETRSSDSRVASWILSLEYNEHTNTSEKPKLHKLSPDLPYYDTKPPPGVDVVKIQVVHVNMLLTPTLNTSSRILVPSETLDHTPEEEIDADMLLCANDALDDAWSSLLFDNPDDIECNDPQMYFTAQLDHMLPTNIGTQGTELQKYDASTTQKRSPYLTPPSSQETLAQSQKDLKSAALQIRRMSTRDVLQVVETGLKHATLKSPIQKIKSAAVSSNEGFRSLASVAPTLWVPDYHRSVSSRAVLIPAISQAIANVSSRASTNLGLSEKIRQSARQQSCNNDQVTPGNVRVQANESQKTLSVQIWQGMTSNLSSTAVARKLQPFSDVAEPNDHEGAYGSVEDMLDEIATDQESFRSCDERDFEDLHETLSEFDEEATDEMDDLGELEYVRSDWSGGLEDRLLDHWDLGDFSPSDFEFEMLGEDLEFEERKLCSVVELDDDSNLIHCHQGIMSRDGSCSPLDLIDPEFREIETVEYDVESLMAEPCS